MVAFSTPPMQQWRLRSETGTMHRWRVYIAAVNGRGWERLGEAYTGRPCNLVIDQFVTIWHFVCIGPGKLCLPRLQWSTSKRSLFRNEPREVGPTDTICPSPEHWPSSSRFLSPLFLHFSIFLGPSSWGTASRDLKKKKSTNFYGNCWTFFALFENRECFFY